MEIVFIVIGLVVGCIIGFLLAKSKGGADATKLALLEQENERVKNEATDKDSKISKLSSDYNAMMSERDVMKANVKNLEGQLANEKLASDKKVQELNSLMTKQSENATLQLATQKEHSDKVFADTKAQYESQLASQKTMLEGQVADTKKRCDGQLAEQKGQYEGQIAKQAEQFNKQLNDLKIRYESQITSQSEQYDKQIADLKSRYDNQLESTKKHYEAQLEELRTKASADLEAYKLVAEKQRKELAETNNKATSETIRQYETQIANLKLQYAKQLEDLKTQQTEQAEQQMNLIKEQMNTASEKILKERSEQLSEKNKESLDRAQDKLREILNPLKDGITQMKDAVEKSGQEHKETMVRLDATIKHSIEQSREVGERADKLAQALTGENKTQGNFGELRLKQLLEDMGLEEGTQFEEQTTMRDASGRAIYDEEDGHRMVPDVILHFPDERDVIIDSKMSFKAFEDYHDAENDSDRQEALTRHIASVRQHVNELSRKNYSAYIKEGRGKLDFVLMYVFSESALQLALMNDTTLWKEAYDKGVIITGSQNLYMLLRVLEMTWRQVRQIENQEQMMKTANMVVDRVQMFYERFMKVDEMLAKTQKAFDDVKSVSGASGQSIEVAARKLIKFGAKSSPKRKYQLKNMEDDSLVLEDVQQEAPMQDKTITPELSGTPVVSPEQHEEPTKQKQKRVVPKDPEDDGTWADSFLN